MGGSSRETFRRIQALYATGPLGDLGDARLLERFAAGSGLERENAFAAIVRRHGPMVLAVCRRMLDGVGRAEAEDAFQAVFLVLARRARSLRKPDDLRPWLYGVAVRTAREARRRAARLRAREGGTLDDSHAAPEADRDLFDLRAALDEELERLPGRYREPILLCELEGASRRDAAARLGLAEGTLSSRLARGRDLLRDRLARRGLAVAALGAALAPRPSNAAGLAALGDAAARLAARSGPNLPAGTVPASVALAEGVLAMLAAARTKALAAASAATLAALALTAGLARGFPDGPPSPAPAQAPQPAPEPEADAPRFRGTVVDEAGRPVAGAEVILDPYSFREVRGTTGADGTYELTSDRKVVSYPKTLARTPDGRRAGLYRTDRQVSREEAERPVRIVAGPTREVRVRVLDAAGEPAPGATVEAVHDFAAIARETAGPDGEALLRIPPDAVVSWIVGQKPGVGLDYAEFGDLDLRPGRTEGVAADRLPKSVALTLGEPRTVRIKAVDEQGGPLPNIDVHVWLLKRDDHTTVVNYISRIHQATTGPDGVAVFDWLPRSKYALTFWPMSDEYADRRITITDPTAAEVVARMEKKVSIRGRVTFADGSPAGGIKVVAAGSGRGLDEGRGRSETDADGRYAMAVSPGEAYAVWVESPDWAAPARMDVIVRPGGPVDGVDFRLGKGTLVTGTVSVGPDRRPPAGWVSVTITQAGGQAPEELREEGDPYSRRIEQFVTAALDPQGRYAIRLGPGKYEAFVDGGGRSSFEIGDQAELIQDFHMDRPAQGPFSGRVVDPSGGPVAGARVEIAPVDGIRTEVVADADGRFRTERRLARTFICARNADGSLGAIVEVGPDDPEAAIVVAPTATATGRLLDEQGEPARRQELDWGFRVHRAEDESGAFSQAFGPEVVTDDEGRFTLPALVVGRRFEIGVKRGNLYPHAGSVRPTKPGPMDLGDLRIGSARADESSTFKDGAPDVGDAAPAFEATTLDGGPLGLADFAGKFVLLDFWATWCGPCAAEIPHIRAAYDAFGAGPDARLAVVGLSLDASIDEPRKFQDDRKLPWTMGFLKGGLAEGPNAAYGVRAIPALFLIGPDGRVVARGLRGEKIQEAVAKALGEKP